MRAPLPLLILACIAAPRRAAAARLHLLAAIDPGAATLRLGPGPDMPSHQRALQQLAPPNKPKLEPCNEVEEFTCPWAQLPADVAPLADQDRRALCCNKVGTGRRSAGALLRPHV